MSEIERIKAQTMLAEAATGDEIIATLIDDDDRRLTIEKTSPENVSFRAALVTAHGVAAKTFPDASSARNWLHDRSRQREVQKREAAAHPITLVIVNSRAVAGKRLSFETATLRGIRANDGEWKVTDAKGRKRSSPGKSIMHRMTEDDAAELTRLSNEADVLREKISHIKERYYLSLPYTYGRTDATKALEIDTKVAKIFRERAAKKGGAS
jgi:hypothetical protein